LGGKPADLQNLGTVFKTPSARGGRGGGRGGQKNSSTLISTPSCGIGWLTILLRIREVLGSSIGPEMGCTESGYSWFSAVLTEMCWNCIL